MSRSAASTADDLLGKELKVLNAGFVRLVDYMGGDSRIVQSARVSYGEGTKTIREDRGLIHYLLRNAHTSPFEQVVLTFHIKAPIFVARQWVRHRTARMNEVSGRYSVMADEFYLPELDDVRFQSKSNKQGRSIEEVPNDIAESVIQTLRQDQQTAYAHYSDYIQKDIARELARVNLPLSLYTEFYWQMDLHNLFHFLKLRLDAHAQKEIRVYGEALATCAKAVAPVAYEAFEEHILNAVTLSKNELQELRKVITGIHEDIGVSLSESLKQKLSIG
jgi:thymidylate synthase (FAD)